MSPTTKKLLYAFAVFVLLATAGGSYLWGLNYGRLTAPPSVEEEWRPRVLLGMVVGVKQWHDCVGHECNQAPRTELLMLDKNGQQAWMEVPAEWAAASDPPPVPGTFCDLNP